MCASQAQNRSDTNLRGGGIFHWLWKDLQNIKAATEDRIYVWELFTLRHLQIQLSTNFAGSQVSYSRLLYLTTPSQLAEILQNIKIAITYSSSRIRHKTFPWKYSVVGA